MTTKHKLNIDNLLFLVATLIGIFAIIFALWGIGVGWSHLLHLQTFVPNIIYNACLWLLGVFTIIIGCVAYLAISITVEYICYVIGVTIEFLFEEKDNESK